MAGFQVSQDAAAQFLVFVFLFAFDIQAVGNAIEFFDHHSMRLIRQKVQGIPAQAHCGLFMEVEEDPDLELWFEMLESCGALVDDLILAEDEASREQLYQVRHAIPAGVNEMVIANGMPKVGTDFSVPDHGLQPMM